MVDALESIGVGDSEMNKSATATTAALADKVAGRERLIELLRRDLVGPHPDLDPALAREVLSGANPSNWYLTGFLGPRRTTGAARRLAAVAGSDAAQEEVAQDLLEAQRGSEG